MSQKKWRELKGTGTPSMPSKKNNGVAKPEGNFLGQNFLASQGQGERPKLGEGTVQYDYNYFVVPARDNTGQTSRAWCQLQPTMDYEMDKIVQSRYWAAFNTKGAFMRWAIKRGIDELHRIKPSPGSMLNVCDAINEICRKAELLAKFRHSVESMEKTVRMFIDMGNEEEALKLLSNVRDEVMKMEEPKWKEQYLSEFDKRFGHIWERNKKNAVNFGSASREG